MRCLQKLLRNGNSTQVTIPRPVLMHLGWLTGQAVILEVLENNTILLRIPVSEDFAPKGRPRIVFEPHTTGAR
jgi:antitoxin component of MazEF toxin-antitoxin module